jgi:hypothetical protein
MMDLNELASRLFIARYREMAEMSEARWRREITAAFAAAEMFVNRRAEYEAEDAAAEDDAA